MFHIIYKITNLINQKIYIGKHSTEDINDAYMGSGSIIKLAVKCYGEENFKREIISYHETEELVYLEESKIVTPEFCAREDTYNIRPGGKGFFIGRIPENKGKKISDETRAKISYASSHRSKETLEKLSKSSKGRTQSLETRKKHSISNQNPTKETLEKMSYASKGRTQSLETRKKNSTTKKNQERKWIKNIELNQCKLAKKDELEDYLNSGWILGRFSKESCEKVSKSSNSKRKSSFEGKKHSLESCKNMSITKKNQEKKWIKNIELNQCKSVKKDELEDYLNSGWILGRLTISDDTREKMSKSCKGRKLSEKHRNNISEGGKGKKRSEETRKNMSNSKKGKKWIKNIDLNQRLLVNPDELEDYLNLGWTLGMK